MKIAIVKLSALGDIIHSMIVLQLIKQYKQDILIDWIVEENYKEVLDLQSDINQVHTVNLKNLKKEKSFAALVAEFKKIRNIGPYDLVIDMQGLIKSAIISRLIPTQKTIGFDMLSIREKLASFFYSETFFCSYDQNVIERNIKIIEFSIGFNSNLKQIKNKDPLFNPSNVAINSNLSKTKKNIIIIPGASFRSKCYSVKKFGKLTTLIDANFMAVWGNPEEKQMSLRIKEYSPKVIICEALSIDSLALLISESDLVIGGDTGPTHMAWALNIPSITLFGPTPGYRNTYKTKINWIIESESKVNPKKINKNDFSINSIPVQKILKASLELLEN
jgi:heptosyltransferase I